MTPTFDLLGDEYEMVVHGHDPATGMRAIIGIHSTALGPALGGVRFHPYTSEEAAMRDVLRLARGMSYKAAAAGLDLGGGKAVLLGDPHLASDELFRSFGRFVDTLAGRYITAADVGIASRDIDTIASVTSHVGGTTAASGDPSPVTAIGVLHAIQAVVEVIEGTTDLEGRHIAVQGVGKVGAALVDALAVAGARLTLADVDASQAAAVAARTGAAVVGVDEIVSIECDVFAPCALGAVFDDHTVPLVRARGIAGAANNQLALPRHGEQLHAMGVVYAPDYVANAGGLINIDDERYGYDRERALGKAAAIGDRVRAVFARAEADAISPAAAAESIARERLAAARH
jgi:leucine dehydrogenase